MIRRTRGEAFEDVDESLGRERVDRRDHVELQKRRGVVSIGRAGFTNLQRTQLSRRYEVRVGRGQCFDRSVWAGLGREKEDRGRGQ